MTALRFLCMTVLSMAVAAPAQAQGHGNGHGGGKSSTHSGPPASQQAPAGTGVRAFGVWLDDASVMTEGSGWVSLSIGHWRTPLFRQTDLPTIDGGYGLWRRVQVGASIPYYRASDGVGGAASAGLGDAYVNAKIQLRAAADSHTVGFAVIPVVELLGEAGPDGRRAHWALLGSIEIQRQHFRVYGTAGYFSRRALFASGAIDVPVSDRIGTFGSLTHSYSMRPDPVAVGMGLNQQRTDVAGGGTYALSSSATIFGSVGRTISRADATSATLAINAGFSVTFQRGQARIR
jgi:hypothetical protein